METQALDVRTKAAPEAWHRLPASDALLVLKSDARTGLSSNEAQARLARYGTNELTERGGKPVWVILWEQITSTMVLILIVAAALSAALKDLHNGLAILAIVVLNAILGASQEVRAEKALTALKKLTVPTVKVRRDGRVLEISSGQLVPGDVMLLEAGNWVAADARLIECANLKNQESALTGESEPVEKDADITAGPESALGDRKNMVYKGTVVANGRGLAVVTGTGMRTELGKIAHMMQAVTREPTPLQKRLDTLGNRLAAASFVIVGIVFALGILRGEDLKVMFLTGVSLAVAAVPEGLPAVVTIALALGAQRMLKRSALIRKLPAVETLGSVTVICSDKTGTLTQNRMTAVAFELAGRRVDIHDEPAREKLSLQSLLQKDPALALLLMGSSLCNDAHLLSMDGAAGFSGDPTEGALLVAAAREGFGKSELENLLPRRGEIPFDSVRKRMTTFHKVPPEGPDAIAKLFPKPYVAFTKGSVDGLLEISADIWVRDHIEPLTSAWAVRVMKANQELAESGSRVLGLAFRTVDAPSKNANNEGGLVFVGMVGMTDPARPEAGRAVQTCKEAGIRPIMITGDHPLTARAIARELGIDDKGRVVTGQELERMTAEELENIVDEVAVYARVSPEHKLRIVEALQNRGHHAAMTGDGVNDAPALKKADIGIAMGRTGTDVTKEASDMVLLDDNFATIVAAVEEGRIIYDNIRKFVKYLLTSNSAEILVMFLAPLLGMPLPLLPLQILWINLVTDGPAALALSVEPAERGAMRRAPVPPGESIFARGMANYIVWVGLLTTALSLGAGAWYWHAGRESWQTMIFTILALSQMAQVLAVRSEKESLFNIGILSNPWLLGAVALTVLLQAALIYSPPLSRLFKTVPLTALDLGLSVLLSASVFCAIELQKMYFKLQKEEN